jgi:hypothetical protein
MNNRNDKKIYYKVVDHNKKSFFYSRIGSESELLDSLCVIYKLGEFVYPKLPGSKLYVFDNLASADNFFRHHRYRYDIYACEIKNPSKNVILTNWDCPYRIINMWKKRQMKKKYSHYTHDCDIYSGSVMCDAVKLIKRVE